METLEADTAEMEEEPIPADFKRWWRLDDEQYVFCIRCLTITNATRAVVVLTGRTMFDLLWIR